MSEFTKNAPACFAPTITREKLARYETLVEDAPARVADYMSQLIDMVKLFYETPTSSHAPRMIPVRLGTKHEEVPAVKLEDEEIERIWDAVPWMDELDVMGKQFDTLSAENEADRELRNAAFHLLWYGRELTLDREPMTKEACL
jgi:hypothetical protein